MILLINDHSYSCDRKQTRETIKVIKQRYKKNNVIVALEKDGIMECRKDEYEDPKTLLHDVQKWIALGYKVHYCKNLLK